MVVLGCLAAIEVTPGQEQAQKKYPYPEVRDMRGVVPPGPKGRAVQQSATRRRPVQLRDLRTAQDSCVGRDQGLVAPVERGVSPRRPLDSARAGDMLITERIGRLRLVRNGVLQPEPVKGTPKVVSISTMAGLMDIALHPRFAENKWVYISYHKPVGMGKSADGKDFPTRQQLDPARHVGRQPAHRRPRHLRGRRRGHGNVENRVRPGRDALHDHRRPGHRSARESRSSAASATTTPARFSA